MQNFKQCSTLQKTMLNIIETRYFADYLNCTTSREKHFDDCAASYHPVLWIFTFGPAARTAEEEHGQPRCRFCRFNYVSVSALAAMLRSFCAQAASISAISHGSIHELFLISKTKGNLAGMRRTHSPNSKERKHNLKASEDVAAWKCETMRFGNSAGR